jgi:hypothetical protein
VTSADRIDAPGNLVARHSRILNWPEPLLYERIAVADTAGFHLDAHLPTPGLWNRTLDNFKVSSWLANLYGFHANSFLDGFCEACDEEFGKLSGLLNLACVSVDRR